MASRSRRLKASIARRTISTFSCDIAYSAMDSAGDCASLLEEACGVAVPTISGRANESLREVSVSHGGDAESGRFDAIKSQSIAVAVDDKLVQPVEAVLPTRQSVLLRTHVLDEQKSPIGLEHAERLSQSAWLVLDGAEHQRGDDAVENARSRMEASQPERAPPQSVGLVPSRGDRVGAASAPQARSRSTRSPPCRRRAGWLPCRRRSQARGRVPARAAPGGAHAVRPLPWPQSYGRRLPQRSGV